jgi:hypothetical protein
MSNDRYLRGVLTVIAGALVYLCVVLTPMPAAMAQGARTPGEIVGGPAEVVIAGWKLAPDAGIPVQVMGPVSVTGDVRVANELRVSGRVETEQAPRTAARVVLTGWEQGGLPPAPGTYSPLDVPKGRGLPVTSLPR